MSGSGSGGWSDVFDDDDLFADDKSLDSKEYKTKDSCIFLIDCNESMWERNEKGEVLFQNVIQLVSEFIKRKIIANSADTMGVCLYNTKQTENVQGFRNIFELFAIDEPIAKRIKKVEKLMERSEFEERVGSCDTEVEFYTTLWACSNMFRDSEVKNSTTRVFVFTNNDNPNADNPELRSKAVQKFEDLRELDIDVELLGMEKKKGDFDVRLFFQEVISVPVDEDSGHMPTNFDSNFEELAERFKCKEYKKRALGTVLWELGHGVDLGVKLYCLLRSASKDSATQLDSEQSLPLQCRTQWICADTGNLLEPHQIQKYYPYGGEKVKFSKEEMTELKDFGQPGLVLMGFKPKKALKTYQNIKNPYFVFPDDTKIKGSVVAFNALLTECASQGKIAICRMIYRRGGVPRFCALLPQLEVRDEDDHQVFAPGFHLVFLPYADDIRNLKLEPTPIANDELILKAKKVVDKLKIAHEPGQFNNPALQHHYAVLQALALDEDLPEEMGDDLLPDEEGFSKRKAFIDEFEACANEGVEQMAQAPSKKRKAPSSKSGGGASKKAKAGDVSFDDVDWAGLAASGQLKKKTVAVLKVYLKKKNLALSGKKADLLERILTDLGF